MSRSGGERFRHEECPVFSDFNQQNEPRLDVDVEEIPGISRQQAGHFDRQWIQMHMIAGATGLRASSQEFRRERCDRAVVRGHEGEKMEVLRILQRQQLPETPKGRMGVFISGCSLPRQPTYQSLKCSWTRVHHELILLLPAYLI